jgi:hypothetical protein
LLFKAFRYIKKYLLNYELGIEEKKRNIVPGGDIMTVIPALRRPRQGNCKLEARLDYVAGPCQKKRKKGRVKKYSLLDIFLFKQHFLLFPILRSISLTLCTLSYR